MTTARRLYRSQTNKVLAGICGGIGEYLDTDPTVVRLVWVVLTLLGGSGILLYILGLFIIPKRIGVTVQQEEKKRTGSSFGGFVGAAFVVVGFAILLDNLNIFYVDEIWEWSWQFVLPSLLILGGIFLLMKKDRPVERTSPEPTTLEGSSPVQQPSSERKLCRSRIDRRIFGVCGGLGQYFEVDATIVRLLYALFTVLSFGTGIVVYCVLYFVLPDETSRNANQPSAS
jgi:phage shock protein PspC (stress-responsive transcriptional regulator)